MILRTPENHFSGRAVEQNNCLILLIWLAKSCVIQAIYYTSPIYANYLGNFDINYVKLIFFGFLLII
jgi:hypothetical protein